MPDGMRWAWRLGVCWVVTVWASGWAAATPTVFWTSEPVGPGQTVLVTGDGLGAGCTVEVARFGDAAVGQPAGAESAWPSNGLAVEVLQAGPQSLKFRLPESLPAGVLAFRLTTADGVVTRVLNRPDLWWVQGDQGTSASPGGWLRAFGRNLSPVTAPAVRSSWLGLKRTSVPTAVALLRNHRRLLSLPIAGGDDWSIHIPLPADLVVGDYEVSVHGGRGGPAGWSAVPLRVSVGPAPAWPQTVFDVRRLGARGTGTDDDTPAVRDALAKAEANGGGIVYFPRGRYQLRDGIRIPRFTVLRGQKTELACLLWPDLEKPPEALVSGSNSFGIEDLTLYASRYRHVIVGDLGDRGDAGDVCLQRVRVRANTYLGHLTPEQVDARFRDDLKLSTGGGDTVRLGGRNVRILDCDLYGSGRSLFLSRVRGGRVAGNTLSNGRWGWYCVSGSDGLVIEGNELVGGDLMSTGGGLNCLDGSRYSQNVYLHRNRFSRLHGWDREAMTSDAGGDAYYGPPQFVSGQTLILKDEPKWGDRPWAGAGVFVLDGRGAGQYRRVVQHTNSTVELDRPWAVDPDPSSALCITQFQGRYIVADNEFTDTGAMQFYGTSVECVVAGNRGTRMQGFRGLGLWYQGYQPSWFCQFLGNTIAEGNYYHWSSAADACLEVSGSARAPYTGPMNRASILRGNRLAGQAHIRVAGATCDALVEGNRVANSELGVFVSRNCRDVLVRANRFENVAHAEVDEEAIRRAAAERMKRYLGRLEPVAAWCCEAVAGGRVADSSGNGFAGRLSGDVKVVPDPARGPVLRFDGTACLRVEEIGVFNAPDMTVSLWVRPDTVAGRRGFVTKRFGGIGAPFVLSQTGSTITFEACEDPSGVWTFNFASPSVLKAGQWTHVAAVAKGGVGVWLYADGKPVAEKLNPGLRTINDEPLVIGREAWGGDPPKGETPGFLVGAMDEVRVWTRALSPEEVAAEFARSPVATGTAPTK